MKTSFYAFALSTMLTSVKLAMATTYTINFDPDEVGMTTIGPFPVDAYADKGISSITCENVAPNGTFDPPPAPQCAFKGSATAGEIANADKVIYEFCGPTDIERLALYTRWTAINGVPITFGLDVSTNVISTSLILS